MTIPLVISLLKNLFIFKQDTNSIKLLKEKMKEVGEKNNLDIKAVEGFVILISLLLSVYYTVYYILASIFVNEIFFVVISFLLLVRSWKVCFKFMSLEEFRPISLIKKIFWRLVNLGYLGFLSYSLYIKW